MVVRLKDIAELMGVSVNTVSRALKDKPDIGEKTRQRIKEAAAALGYRPDLNARSLVLQKTSTIGLAVTESDNPVRMEFCENSGSERNATATAYSPHLFAINGMPTIWRPWKNCSPDA